MPPLPGSPAIEGAVEAFAFSSLTLIDTDNDGIDDRLEPGLGLTVGTDDSASDQDHDGQTDAQELGSMTNPLNANSRFGIASFEQTGTDGSGDPIFTIIFPCFPGLSYSIQADQNLDFGDPNQTLGPIFPTGHTHTQQVTVMPGRDFVRVIRN